MLYNYGTAPSINIYPEIEISEPCIKCPYGSQCPDGVLKPNPGYWGVFVKKKLKFYQCPHGYCCSGNDKVPCNEYNACAPKRNGTLCGSCQDGFSLSIFSDKCVSSHKCDSSWIWPLAVGMVLIFLLWYSLKDDLFELGGKIQNRTFSCVNYLKICNKKGKGNSDTMKKSNSDSTESDAYFGIIVYHI